MLEFFLILFCWRSVSILHAREWFTRFVMSLQMLHALHHLRIPKFYKYIFWPAIKTVLCNINRTMTSNDLYNQRRII